MSPATGQEISNGTELSRLRFVVETDSEWTRVELDPARFLATHVASQTPGTTVHRRADRFTLSGAQPAHMILEAVVEAPIDGAVALTIDKSMVGTTTVDVFRRNGTEELVLHAENQVHDKDDSSATFSLEAPELIGAGFTPPRLDDRPLTLAFYYPWWSANSQGRQRWAEQPTGAYDTTDASHVDQMVGQAAQAGINGFLVSWKGNQRSLQLDLVFDAADRRQGFYVAPHLELEAFRRSTLLGSRIDLDEAAVAVREYLTRGSRPSALTVDGRPVIFVYDISTVDPAEWSGFRARFAEVNPVWVGDTMKTDFAVEGGYYYSPNGWNAWRITKAYEGARRSLKLAPSLDPSKAVRLWAATASPGYDDRRARLLGWTEPRQAGHRYDTTWIKALESGPDWVLVTSWNEWLEGTNVSPGTKTGARALDQTRHWSAAFSASRT